MAGYGAKGDRTNPSGASSPSDLVGYTLAGNGTVVPKSSVNVSPGDYTIAGNGTVVRKDSIDNSPGDYTLAGNGTVVKKDSIDNSPGDYTLAGNGTVVKKDSIDNSPGDYTLAGNGTVVKKDSIDNSPGDYTLAGNGTVVKKSESNGNSSVDNTSTATGTVANKTESNNNSSTGNTSTATGTVANKTESNNNSSTGNTSTATGTDVSNEVTDNNSSTVRTLTKNGQSSGKYNIYGNSPYSAKGYKLAKANRLNSNVANPFSQTEVTPSQKGRGPSYDTNLEQSNISYPGLTTKYIEQPKSGSKRSLQVYDQSTTKANTDTNSKEEGKNEKIYVPLDGNVYNKIQGILSTNVKKTNAVNMMNAAMGLASSATSILDMAINQGLVLTGKANYQELVKESKKYGTGYYADYGLYFTDGDTGKTNIIVEAKNVGTTKSGLLVYELTDKDGNKIYKNYSEETAQKVQEKVENYNNLLEESKNIKISYNLNDNDTLTNGIYYTDSNGNKTWLPSEYIKKVEMKDGRIGYEITDPKTNEKYLKYFSNSETIDKSIEAGKHIPLSSRNSLIITGNGEKMDSVATWAVNTANNPNIGYGGTGVGVGHSKYDCSGFVLTAYEQAGINTGGADGTSNMIERMTATGHFVYIPGVFKIDDLQPGDILIDKGNHTELYVGNGQVAAAHTDDVAYSKQVSVTDYSGKLTTTAFSGCDGIIRYIGDEEKE